MIFDAYKRTFVHDKDELRIDWSSVAWPDCGASCRVICADCPRDSD